MTLPVSKLLAGSTVVVAFAFTSLNVLAHHPVAAKFNTSDVATLSGRVTTVDWANPHVHVFFNVSAADGSLTNWAVELASVPELEWSGWHASDIKAGDTITVSGPRALNGSHQVWGTSVQHDGKEVFAVAADVFERQATAVSGATPRWPDNQPRLGPAPGETGYWALPSKTSLMEDGVSVNADAHGLLDNLNDAAKVAPLQQWALDLYRLRQRNFLKDDPSFLNCIPPTGPRQFQQALGLQFVEEKARGRIFILHAGGNGNWRLMYTDGRSQFGQVTGNDDNPLFFGRSLAKWEGDTLVVEVEGFNEGFWFTNGGLPHTRALKLTERFTRTDKATLHYEVTIDDKGAYTRPWKSSLDLKWIAGKELPEYYCQDNRQ